MTKKSRHASPVVRPRGRPRKKNKSQTDKVEIERAELVATVLSLRRQGYELAEIGKAIEPPVSKARVHAIIKTALAKIELEPAKDLLTLELLRLDELQSAFYLKAAGGDPIAADKTLAIMDRRAKLLGLNAPEKVEEVGRLVDAKATLLEKLNKMALRRIVPPAPEPITIEGSVV